MNKVAGLLSFIIFANPNHVTGQQTNIQSLKVGIMTDVQYCNAENNGSRHYRSSVRKLEEACNQFRNEQVDWVINLGDFIDHDFKSFDTLNNILHHYEISVLSVIGNHDFAVENSKKPEVIKALGLKERYYSIVKDKWRFLFLDGSDISTYANPGNSDPFNKARVLLDSLVAIKAINAYNWNGAIGKKQIEWIKQQLSLASKAGENIIVSCHFPMYPEDESEKLWNAVEIRSLLEGFPGKVVVFNGHNHHSKYYTSNKITWVSFRGMVEGEENSFAIAEIFSDSLRISGYGAEQSHSVSWQSK